MKDSKRDNYIKSDVVAGIVTYNPDTDRLLSNINAVQNQVDRIVIVDNGSINVAAIDHLITDRIHFIKWKQNKGIASALKTIMDFAIENHYSWVLTVDQDSIVQEGLIEEYLKYANREDCRNVGMFTCLIKDRNFSDKKHEEQKSDIQVVDSCITSAAFCSVEKYRTIDGYDESFFIDCVDFDICYQLRDAGYTVNRINYTGDRLIEYNEAKKNPLMIHFTGHKPNTIHSRHSYRETWWYYAKKSVCYQEIIEAFKDEALNCIRNEKKEIATYKQILDEIKNNDEIVNEEF